MVLKSDQTFYNAKDVSEILGVSVTSAYRVIKRLNEELEAKGYLFIRGKISKKFFDQKLYQ